MAMTITTAMSVFGQNGFSYQAVIRNAEGELITNKQVEVKFTLKSMARISIRRNRT